MRVALNNWLRRVPTWLVWLAGAVPLGLVIADAVTGRLGVDPVRSIEHRLGRTALYLLIASLAVTPVLRLARINAMRHRQALGLLCFAYAACHVASWVLLDMGLLWAQMAQDVIRRPYLLFGMAVILALGALAATSNRLSMRGLGGGWRRLHRLSYPAVILAGLHWIWSLKVVEPWPAAILAAILLLLASRLLPWRPPRTELPAARA